MPNIYPPSPAGIGGAKALMTAMPNAAAVMGAGTVTITSPPTTGTAGVALSLAGTVSPSGTAVNVGLSTSATVAPGSFTAATVSGTGWTASITPSTAGTYYIWAESGSATPAVSAAVTISAGQTALTFSLVSGTGGLTAVSPNTNSVNMGTPTVHASAVTPFINLTVTSGYIIASTAVQFWYDTSATNTNPSGGSVASGTLNTCAGIPGGITAAFNAGVAPASAGTYYAKVQATGTGTDAGVCTFVSQAITVT